MSLGLGNTISKPKKKRNYEFEVDENGKKIIYRVGQKLYKKDEVKFLKEIVGEKNAMDLVRLIVHFITSALMIITMIAIIGIYVWTYYVHRTKNYEYILARVTTQDESVTNRISSITVLKYAIFDNSTYYKENKFDDYKANGTVDVSGNSTGYTDLTPFCETNEIYLAEDLIEAQYMIDGV